MLRTVKTFNSHNINDGTSYRATLAAPNSLPAAQPVFLSQPNDDSVDAGTYTVEAQNLAVEIIVVNYASRFALIAQLQAWFKRGTLGDLVVTYSDDSLNYQKTCRVVNLIQDPNIPQHFTALLTSGATAWRAVDPTTYDWMLTGTGDTHTLAVDGDDETPLSLTLEVTSAPGSGYQYQRYYQLLNFPYPALPLGYGPWCITLDTAALIADNSNKCQLNGAINNSVTTIPYDTVTGAIPTIGSGYVDTEQIRWTGKTGTTSGNLTGVTRGVSGTTAASHLDNAVIKVSYIQANGADLRVLVDGIETNRWFGNINNASTKIWFNNTLSQGASLALREALDNSSDYPALLFAITADTFNAVKVLPNEGILVHGSEWIKYQRNVARMYGVDIVERGILGTTKQAHTIGDTFKLMEHTIQLVYGKISAVNPSTLDTHYDDTKPLFNLASSDNTSWVYDATGGFRDINRTGRTGNFDPLIMQRSGEVTTFYDYKQNATSGDPAMGMLIGSYNQAGVWMPEQGRVLWMMSRACGIDTSTVTGQKYRTLASWPANNVGLRKSTDGVAFQSLWDEVTPASVTTWTALSTHSAISHGGAIFFRFAFHGGQIAGDSAYSAFEILTATINFVSANLPTGTLLAQSPSGQLDLTLTNEANDNEIEIIRPMLIGIDLVMSAEDKTILYGNTNAHEAVSMDDEGRADWIILQPGNNDLTVLSADVGGLTVTLSHYVRRF